MKPLVSKLRPTQGFSHIFHLLLVAALPVLLFVVLRVSYLGLPLALALVVLSKWRMFAVRPRFWPAILRANAVDLTVGISAVIFMQLSLDRPLLQVLWAALYAAWLLILKPGTGIVRVSLQAFVAQFVGLMALYAVWTDGPLFGLVFISALICYVAARHFFDSFEEPYSKMLSYLWAYFAAALVWLLGHWLLYYFAVIAQPTIILTTVGYGLAILYYFDHHQKLTSLLRRQMLTVMLIILLVLIVFSDWGDKVV